MFIKRNAVTELTGPYGEGTLSLVSPNCVHSPTQRPSTQAGVSQPAAPCPSSALSQEPWTHRHSSFPSCTLYRSHSRETRGLGVGMDLDSSPRGTEVVEWVLGTRDTEFLRERGATGCQGRLLCSGNPPDPFTFSILFIPYKNP